MPEMIPVGNTGIQPDTLGSISKMIGLRSSMIGLQQQQQNLQTGAYQQQSAQASAQQDQQKNQELQSLAQFTKSAAQDPSYQNADGSANVQKYQQDAMKVAPTYGQAYIGQMTSNFNGAVENRKAMLGLTKEQQGMVQSGVQSIGQGADATAELSRLRGVSDDPGYQNMLDNLLGHKPNVGMMSDVDAKKAEQQWAAGLSAHLGGPALQLPSSVDQGGQVQPGTTSPYTGGFTPSGSAVPKVPGIMDTPAYKAAVAAATSGAGTRATGNASADITASNNVIAGLRDARANIDLTKRVDQLADLVDPGALPEKVSQGLGALGFQDVNQARSELVKDLGRIRGNFSDRAGSDQRAATVLEGLPTDKTPTQTIHQAMDLTRGTAKQDLALGQIQAKSSGVTGGNMNGFQGDYAHAVSAASPLMHEYMSLSPQDQVGFFRRNFKTRAQAEAFRAQANSVKKMSPDVFGQQ